MGVVEGSTACRVPPTLLLAGQRTSHLCSFCHFLLTTCSSTQLHHCTCTAGGGDVAAPRMPCPQVAPTPAGAEWCPTAGSITRTPTAFRKCYLHPSTPAPLLPVPLHSHCSRSIFLESSGRVPSVLEDKKKVAGWGSSFREERGTRHPVTPHTGGGMQEVLLSSIWHPASATNYFQRAPYRGWRCKDRPHLAAELGKALLHFYAHCSSRPAGRGTP